MIFKTLQDEVKRRATRNQGGTNFDEPIKNILNTSLSRLCREALWKPLRRKTTFSTIAGYSKGSGAGTFTLGSDAITVVGATFITDGIRIGRRIKLSGDNTYHTITQVTAETGLVIAENYSATASAATGTYGILGQEEYVLPIQVGSRMFMWHEEYGYPMQMSYITDQDFYSRGLWNTMENIPTAYRMWGEDMVIEPLLEPSIMTVSSTSTSDTAIDVTVFGTVSGYPDYETIVTDVTDGTTQETGSKSFSSIERVVKKTTSVGRINVTANSGNCNVAVLPVGFTTTGIKYSKIQLTPLPNSVFPVNIQYYKEPYKLVEDNDVHELGEEFDEALILISVAKIKYESDQKEGDKWISMYIDEVRSLRKKNVDKIDWFPSLRRPGDSGGKQPRVHPVLSYNQVGAYYGPRVR